MIALRLSSSMAMWWGDPSPGDPIAYWPGLARAFAIASPSVFAGKLRCAAR